MKKIIFLLIVFTSNHSFYGLPTLSSLQSYANMYEEFPKPDNNNWLDANFTSYHKSIKAGWWDKLLHWVGFERNNRWDPEHFKNLLLDCLEQRKKLFGSGRLINTFLCSSKCDFYIFGDLHGAFHSLVRDLAWMHQNNILDNTLKIIKPHSYIVFNGDAINRSPYILETIHVLILLLYQNPDKVIYIRGNHEDEGHWINYGLKRELKIRVSYNFDNQIPLQKEINDFFSTLPLALFIANQNNINEAIRISHRDRTSSELVTAEKSLHEYFAKRKEKLGIVSQPIIATKADKQKTEDTEIVTIIETQPWRHEVKGITGLNHLEQDRGSTAWSILSSPIEAHQNFLDFYYDAFAMLSIKQPITQSTISLYNRDIRKDDSELTKKATFNIISGSEITKENENDSPQNFFTVGSTMSLIKGVPILGQRIKRGMATKINEVNTLGGVGGQHVKTIVYNDDYIPHLARPNVDRLLTKNKTDIILLPVGTPTLTSYDEYAQNGKTLVLFPVTGAPEFRNEKYKWMVHFRNTYAQEVEALIDYMIDVRAAKKFAFFYQDDSFGGAPLEAARKALKAKGIEKWAELPYLRGSTNFKTQVQKIMQDQPDAIGFFSTAQATREFMRMLGVDFLSNKQLFGISFLGEESFRRYINKQGINVLLGAVVPNPKTSELQIAKEYRALMDKLKYPYDVFSFEAYIATSILMEVLSKISPPFTKEKILQHIESFNNYDFKGLPLTFNPKTRSLIPYIWLESGNNEEWVRKEISTLDHITTDTYTPQKQNDLPAPDTPNKEHANTTSSAQEEDEG